MYRIKRGSFFDFYQMNKIHNNYYKTDYGRYNSNLLQSFIKLLLNDILRFFKMQFWEVYCLFKDDKMIGVTGYHILPDRKRVGDAGTCIIPEERGKGLAKHLCRTVLRILKKEGRKELFVSEPKIRTYEGKTEVIDVIYHYKLKNSLPRIRLKNNSKTLKVSEYKSSDFEDVIGMIKKIVKKDYPFFTNILSIPYKTKIEILSLTVFEKILSLLGHVSVWRFVARHDEKIVGYSEIKYYKNIKELSIYFYLICNRKSNEIGSLFLEEILKKIKKLEKINIHIFIKTNIENNFISSEFMKSALIKTKLYIKYLKLT